MILKNLLFYIVLFNLKHSFCNEEEPEFEIPDGNPETKIPIAININNEKSTSQCIFSANPDNNRVTFDPKENYAIDSVNSLASKVSGGSDQEIWTADSPSQRAFKVVGYNLSKQGKKVLIYQYDGTVLSYIKETGSDKYVDESEINELEKNRQVRFAYSKVLLYILTTFLGFILLLVLGIGIPMIIRRRKQASQAVLRPDFTV